MKIFVDFDRVAFDTNRLYELLDKVGIEPGTLESLEYLYPHDGEPVVDLLFEDFKRFAMRQRERGNEVILVSSAIGFSGDWGMTYHAQKIERSGVGKFVTRVVPVPAGKTETLQSELQEHEKGVFIDDSAQHLRELSARSSKHVTYIQMVRTEEMRTGAGLKKVECDPEFPVVKDFDEVVAMLNKT